MKEKQGREKRGSKTANFKSGGRQPPTHGFRLRYPGSGGVHYNRNITTHQLSTITHYR